MYNIDIIILSIKNNKAKLCIIYGFLESGKTIFAKKLEAKHKAIRFLTDEWMIGIFNFNGSFGKIS